MNSNLPLLLCELIFTLICVKVKLLQGYQDLVNERYVIHGFVDFVQISSRLQLSRLTIFILFIYLLAHLFIYFEASSNLRDLISYMLSKET